MMELFIFMALVWIIADSHDNSRDMREIKKILRSIDYNISYIKESVSDFREAKNE